MRCLLFFLFWWLPIMSYAQNIGVTKWQKRIIRKVWFDPKHSYASKSVLPELMRLLLDSKISAYSDCWHTRIIPTDEIRSIVYDTVTSYTTTGEEILTPLAPVLLDTGDFGGMYIAEDITMAIETDIITVSIAGIAPLAKPDNQPRIWLGIGDINYNYPNIAKELLGLASYMAWQDMCGNNSVRQKNGTLLSIKGIKTGSCYRLQEYPGESTEMAATPLAERFTGAVLYFGLNAYTSPLTDREHRYDEANLRQKIKPVVDTFVSDDICSKGKFVTYREFCFSCIDSFNVSEKIDRNENNGNITIALKGIAPVYYKYDDQGNAIGNDVLFWLKYEDAAPLLQTWHSNYPLDNVETSLWQQLVDGK